MQVRDSVCMCLFMSFFVSVLCLYLCVCVVCKEAYPARLSENVAKPSLQLARKIQKNARTHTYTCTMQLTKLIYIYIYIYIAEGRINF